MAINKNFRQYHCMVVPLGLEQNTEKMLDGKYKSW